MLLAAAAVTAPEAAGQVRDNNTITSESRRQARLFDEHIVRMGQTAFSIARGYGISPKILAEDNSGIDLTRIRVGQVLLIRKRERGHTELAEVARQWEEMTAARAARAAADEEMQTAEHLPVDSVLNEFSDRYEYWVNRRREESGRGRGLRDFSQGGVPNIAVMLPLDQSGSQFTDFWKGALLALERLKTQGRSARVTLYNSGNSARKVEEIVSADGFSDTDLVIGPVYEQELGPVVDFGEAAGIPVVSPLASLREIDSDAVWQMAPDSGSKYDKLRHILWGDANIVVVTSGAGTIGTDGTSGEANDLEFEREIVAELGDRPYRRFTIGGGGNIVSMFDWERPNVLIVLAGNEQAVNFALATIQTSRNSNPRSRLASITVIGTSKWAGYNRGTLAQELLFDLSVRFVTNYHIDRSDMETRLFEARYLETYGGDFPSKSAFRGYDAVALFVGALFESGATLEQRIERVGATPLGTTYRFVRSDGGGGGRHVNDQWEVVSFSKDYNITIQ